MHRGPSRWHQEKPGCITHLFSHSFQSEKIVHKELTFTQFHLYSRLLFQVLYMSNLISSSYNAMFIVGKPESREIDGNSGSENEYQLWLQAFYFCSLCCSVNESRVLHMGPGTHKNVDTYMHIYAQIYSHCTCLSLWRHEHILFLGSSVSPFLDFLCPSL